MAIDNFTPGPWKVAPCENVTGFRINDADGRLLFMACNATENYRGESLYNSNLAAAAPDMHHALQMLVGVLDDCRRGTDEGNIPPGILDRFDEATNVCRAALRKARGEA